MKLFFLQNPKTEEYLGRLLVTREGYVPTSNVSEAQFYDTIEDAQEIAAKYPEFEVMCFGLTMVKVRDVNDNGESSIPGVSQLEVDMATKKLTDALEDLDAIRPTMFVELDDNDTVSNYSGTVYSSSDDRIYIELEYPRN